MKRNAGFSLVELVVVVAILGVLTALILPAVQSAREASRRAACTTKLSQIGLAFANYHDSNRCFPVGRIQDVDPRGDMRPGFCFPTVSRCKSLWVQMLPQIGEQSRFDSYNYSLAVVSGENVTVIRETPAAFVCPSDNTTAAPNGPEEFVGTAPASVRIGRSSYAACFGTLQFDGWVLTLPTCKYDPKFMEQNDGTFNNVTPIRFRDVSDGLSKTMFVADRSYAVIVRDSAPSARDAYWHGWWAGGGQGDGLFCAMYPPNGGASRCKGAPNAATCGASSMHPGGVNVLMGDGSTAFVAESVNSWAVAGRDCSPDGAKRVGDWWVNVPQPGVWQAMATRSRNESTSTP